MPELPEMENYKTLLIQLLRDKEITDIKINREKSINKSPSEFTHHVINKKVVTIERRAKHLIFTLDSGKCLLLHLMLGGFMYIGNEKDSPDRTKQVILSFGDIDLFFIGLRLGYLHLLDKEEVEKELSDLGPEPLENSFPFGDFHSIIDKKRGMLKTMLIDQQFLSGIGNCYSDEICFKAELLPTKKADELNDGLKRNLYDSILTVLKRATDLGGYMDYPLYKGDILTGGYNNSAYVYDREGLNCRRCSGLIKKDEISSRKTFYCPNCQR